ncbi:HEAT repeat domain-containing protein [Treponema sp. OttesenSCG-928-L16]|nr:HEAT repeat domain-containing protein [Treponema sp. OttesenSCG-928-L16]
MVSLKRFIALFIIFLAAVSMVMGQSSTREREMSVEESYLQQSVEAMIIREQSRAETRDMKMIALEYIGEAIDNGTAGEEVRSALEYMALEGVVNKSVESGRVVNNFPDVRARSAMYLGELGTEEAKTSLIKIMLADPEPMVLTEAVKSLAKIGINNNEETVTVISWVVTRFDVLNPDNLLALAALDAYEILAEKNNGIRDPSAFRTIIRIAEGPYIRPVQERAKQTLSVLRRYTSSSSSSSSSSSGTNQNQQTGSQQRY